MSKREFDQVLANLGPDKFLTKMRFTGIRGEALYLDVEKIYGAQEIVGNRGVGTQLLMTGGASGYWLVQESVADVMGMLNAVTEHNWAVHLAKSAKPKGAQDA